MHNNNILQTRTAQLRAAASPDADNRTYEFVISSEAPDTYDTVFLSSGWELERYHRNPVVLYNHNSWSNDPDTTIGTSIVRVEGNLLVATLTLEEGNALADKVKRQIDNGVLKMASVGAQIHEGRRGVFDDGENPDLVYFTRQELLEWSVTPVGSNPDAVKRNKESINTAFAKADQQQPNGIDNQSSRTTKTAQLDEFEAAYIFNKNNQ